MDQPDRIHLRDHVVSADIGAFQSERGQDQRLRFNLTVDLAEPVEGTDDEVDAILSYDVLTGAVTSALGDQRYNLVETLAERIAAEVLAHPRAVRIEVTVEKLDRGPGALGVTIARQAGRVATGPSADGAAILFFANDVPIPAGRIVVADGQGDPQASATDRMIALLALDQAAWRLGARLGLDVVASRTELDWAAATGRSVIWAPARMAADVAGLAADPMALTLWLADRLQARRLEFALPAGRDLPALPEGFSVPVSVAP
ncbi:dihydroneopterin aldolase [Paracoccus sp. TK19116]|uniref:dihydroneopterin aldolase n=1 Tax=Paracoccus albicereus TaxID=2922394 RepID=A0ABT1MVN5_9RHOB|nr:dihydroneopterin aldolase [Paracoccus albicereus]MCQ0971734.1 dihydroneopterin aldolase [Paracoccus albicereus]